MLVIMMTLMLILMMMVIEHDERKLSIYLESEKLACEMVNACSVEAESVQAEPFRQKRESGKARGFGDMVLDIFCC